MPSLALIPLGIAGAQFISSLLEKKAAKRGLAESERLYGSAGGIYPELAKAYQQALEMSRFGETPEEAANFQQQLTRSQNTGYQRGVDAAPGMAQQLLAGQNYVNVGAQNQHASNVSRQHMDNIRYAHSLARDIQGQRTNYYNRQQEAYGQAAAQQSENMWNALNQGAYYAYKGFGGGSEEEDLGMGTGGGMTPNRMMGNIPGFDWQNLNNPNMNFNRAMKLNLGY